MFLALEFTLHGQIAIFWLLTGALKKREGCGPTRNTAAFSLHSKDQEGTRSYSFTEKKNKAEHKEEEIESDKRGEQN